MFSGQCRYREYKLPQHSLFACKLVVRQHSKLLWAYRGQATAQSRLISGLKLHIAKAAAARILERSAAVGLRRCQVGALHAAEGRKALRQLLSSHVCRQAANVEAHHLRPVA